MQSVRAALRLVTGPVNLLGYDTDATPLAPGKGSAAKTSAADGDELAALQEMLHARGVGGDPRRVLLVLQGMDTAGKDGTIRHVIGLVGPAGVRITAFKLPTPTEAAHHFLWRVRRALPEPGVMGVFNRSHYEDVVVNRVHGRIDESQWLSRIEEINRFERELATSGTVILKCFLHISYTEQRRRLLARLSDPAKHWKFHPADIDERAYWSDYQAAYSGVLERTSTEAAPWYVVPADAKWYRDWAIGRLLSESLRELDLSYPAADFDVDACAARLRPPF
jgi:PPK2 family polyphosphate:nucleotide phosphotransferase